ncbi:MAG: outer membrane protein insertion porin family [Verrucomicrobiota bacterium]|jgi:outer membrane protein assembly complex protein YaeT
MRGFLVLLTILGFATDLFGQAAVSQPRREEQDKARQKVEKKQDTQAQKTSVIEFRGLTVFKEKDVRTALKEQITTIDDYGLSPARGDDVAFFLELFYRKHGYAKVDVHYNIDGDRLRLDVTEGPQFTLGTINFAGNEHEPIDKLFDYAVGPTRERYSKLQKSLPFVEQDLKEGADLVQRFYVAEGFLEANVAPPQSTYRPDQPVVDVTIAISENQQYSFGDVSFTGKTIYDAETLRGQIEDLLKQPYTEARQADIPRRLQTYFKERGYYDIKAEATSDPTTAQDGRVPVQVAISPGPVYHFGGATISGLKRLQPSYVTKRFSSLQGKVYSPDAVDERFRALMRTGLFNLLQIQPVPIEGEDLLLLQISAEEAKSKEFGFSLGYGSYVGGIIGLQFRDRDLFGYGRPLTTSVEINERGYKGEILWEDPYFFDSDFGFKARIGALTFDFDGYSKFELGERIELSRKITKQYEAGVTFSVRHVEVTSADIKPQFLGPTSYFVNTLGFTQTLDLRKSPLVNPRGLVIDSTVDVATNAFGSEIEFVRTTGRVSYYIPFNEESKIPGVALAEDLSRSFWERWYRQTLLAFGGRVGAVHSLGSESSSGFDLPIDERFFNGGSTTVRSFGERDLGPRDRHGNPLGGEFFTVFNAEYTFPIYGELQGAVFFDAGNLLPSSDNPSLDEMRYAIGGGLRYKLPIGPIRLDYGINPDPRTHEDQGAFHFSFGFAF